VLFRSDYSKPAIEAFRRWLTERYGDDAGLRRAWHNDQVTLAAAEPPSPEARKGATVFCFRDPVKEQPVIDHYRFLNELDAEAILSFMRVGREATNGEALLGTYYGYLTQHWIHQQDSGHCALQKVLESPDIDFLMSPPLYTGRELGGTSGFMPPPDSIKLHGKLYFDESDDRTFLSEKTSGYGRTDTLADSTAVLWRELACVLTKRCAVSWFDMAGNWFSDPELLKSFARVRQVAGEELAARKPFRAEVAVFIDPESFYYLRPGNHNLVVTLQPIVDLPRLGAPADVYLVSDLARKDFPPYRMYVFLNTFYADQAKREMIARRTGDQPCTVVWCYAPGLVSDQGVATENVTALTGVRVAMEPTEGVLQIKPEPNHPLTAGLADTAFGCADKLGPVLWVDDPQAEVAGRLTLNGKPGLAVKREGQRTTIVASTLNVPPGLLRNAARAAGVHIYLDTDDACYADGRYLAVHAKTAGTKTLRLPGPRRVRDVIRDRALADATDTVSLNMAAGETVFLELEPVR